eukprot:CAMPEP_0119129234 /NCGR_PEP_ID=MMETSP1310-20130426/7077_1 /TAXON_ID=464262 /ORGANISM="Genus nov. species nov., Strain RCC2339" /LENGTH=80 /DNA_ID=CAMNT_0007119651 /DNA_START=75 /DNA_END=317 /DNA_ORIENTATION=-
MTTSPKATRSCSSPKSDTPVRFRFRPSFSSASARGGASSPPRVDAPAAGAARTFASATTVPTSPFLLLPFRASNTAFRRA